MALRLKWYEKRCKGKIRDSEHVVAAVHTHTSFLMMMIIPHVFDPFIGRHVVVTNERTIIFGPGMRSEIAEYPKGQANASRTSFHLTVGTERMFVGWMVGPIRGIVNRVIEAANS